MITYTIPGVSSSMETSWMRSIQNCLSVCLFVSLSVCLLSFQSLRESRARHKATDRYVATAREGPGEKELTRIISQ